MSLVVRHYKGGFYRVLHYAERADDSGVELVIYQQLQGTLHRPLGHVWCLPVDEFNKRNFTVWDYPGGKRRRISYRFKVVNVPREIRRAIAELDGERE